ncbi:MAG: 4-(cytidine 5'-diphospho)-2-C-methyl-D-erythritol kinase [Rhodobacteraceae bacterium]|nr:4-(cytidine 5'-diphospho)-2-C-methyl-D-erythritol kinase [Paracoccaceae bacterium]
MKTVKVFAPAKVNLTLHVTGQRPDGYHLIDSLVMFADVGDRVTVTIANKTNLNVTGPMANGVPEGADNLVLRAAALFETPVSITLSKHLPSAAGIGGGSADAAATALAMCELTGQRNIPRGLTALGADIRVCLMRRAARMQGIGERITPMPDLPPLWAVLANPGVEVATPAVFSALSAKQGNAMPNRLPKKLDTGGFIKWLATQRNDLEAPACTLQPLISEVLGALGAQDGAKMTRMSGSGATCFALFASLEKAKTAAVKLAQAHPTWWVRPVSLA